MQKNYTKCFNNIFSLFHYRSKLKFGPENYDFRSELKCCQLDCSWFFVGFDNGLFQNFVLRKSIHPFSLCKDKLHFRNHFWKFEFQTSVFPKLSEVEHDLLYLRSWVEYDSSLDNNGYRSQKFPKIRYLSVQVF